MGSFSKEFKTLEYILEKSENVLLVAHSRPDGDTVGSVLALKEYIIDHKKKNADITCLDQFPSYLTPIYNGAFLEPANLDFTKYDAVIGCDSVERGFDKIIKNLNEDCVTVIIDHHPDISINADVIIIDAHKSSTCELIYDFFQFQDFQICKNIATFLLVGIISDTGNFQHSNTSTRVMEISAALLKRGALLSKIIQTTFSNKKISTLKLWGRAFDKARIDPETGMIVTVLTLEDIAECNASTDDISQVSSLLNTVPGAKFALVLYERENGLIKGSLRSEEYKGVDVSEIAHQFGGGGHKLASGFEVKGKIIETENGWEVA